jgi:hypothetical protein
VPDIGALEAAVGYTVGDTGLIYVLGVSTGETGRLISGDTVVKAGFTVVV